MRSKALIIVLSMLLSSCMVGPLDIFKSREEKDKIIVKKLLRRNANFIKTDTVRYVDTLVTERVEVDSVFKQTTDTVIIKKDNLKIRYVYKNDTVRIDGECDTIKIYVNEPVDCPTIDLEAIQSDAPIPWWIILVIVVLCFIIVFLGIKRI